ncbi:hypothetical protein [Bacillus haynesii]|nr:hypothetical protein [Bacillus haynesii]MCY9322744.1 hypothetical protein [Bacillus haynesii]
MIRHAEDSEENTTAAVACFVFPAVLISDKDLPTTLLEAVPGKSYGI